MPEQARETKERVRRCAAGRWSVELLPCQPYVARYTARELVVGFAFEAQSGVHAFAGDRVLPFQAYPNGLAVVPVGCDVYSRSRKGGEYLSVRCADYDWGGGPCSDHVDEVAIRAAREIRRMLLCKRPPDELLLEELAVILAERALRANRETRRPKTRRLTPNRLKRIEELIDARLSNGITIKMMADELGLSEGSFSRAFREATGKSPYAHVVDRRIALARALIVSTSQDLTQIALAAGFSSHSHMSSAFRQGLGCAPSRLRQ